MYPNADIWAEEDTVPALTTPPPPNPKAEIWAEEEIIPEGIFTMSV